MQASPPNGHLRLLGFRAGFGFEEVGRGFTGVGHRNGKVGGTTHLHTKPRPRSPGVPSGWQDKVQEGILIIA